MGLTSSSVAEEDLRDELETNERPKTQMPRVPPPRPPGLWAWEAGVPALGMRPFSWPAAAARSYSSLLHSVAPCLLSPETSSCFPFLHYVPQPSRRVLGVVLRNITLSFCFVFLSPTGHFGFMFRVRLMECFAESTSFTYKVPCAYHPGEPQVCVLRLTVV